MARQTVTCVGSVFLVFFALTTAAFGVTFKVDDNGVQCPGSFLTIQAAVNAAAATSGGPHLIQVCAGKYPENVTIPSSFFLPKGIQIVGAGTGLVRVIGPPPGTAGPIIAASGSGKVTIRSLTVGPDLVAGDPGMVCPAPPDDIIVGISLVDTDAIVSDVVVQNTRDALGQCQGVGIDAKILTTQTRSLEVSNSTVKNFNRAGISANGRMKSQIKNNVVTLDPGAPSSWAPNGIELARGLVGTVTLNQVHDMVSPDPDNGAGTGITVYCVQQAVVSNNQVFDSDLGVTLADTSKARVTSNEVTDSLFAAITLQYIGTFFGPVEGCPDSPSLTENNQVTNNVLTRNGVDGISLFNFDPAPSGPPFNQPRNNTISNNTITDSGFSGIAVFNGEGNRFVGNRMSGSGLFDAEDDQIPTPNSWKNNICGSPPGQQQNQPGLCKF